MQHAAKHARAYMLGALMVATLTASVKANDFVLAPVLVGTSYEWRVSIDGGVAQHNPTLTLIRGRTYRFEVSVAPIHSFYIKTASSTGSANAYSGGGLSANGISTDTPPGMPITFRVPQTAPNTLFYNCGLHATMAGTITIDGIFANGFE